MQLKFRNIVLLLSAIATWPALALGAEGVPVPWQLNFQPAATPIMEKLDILHTELLYLIIAISVFVLVLLVWIALRYNRKANPTPSKTSHNTLLEIVWTTIPILILVYIAMRSLPLHYEMAEIPEADMTIKVVGYQWYWHYEYPDHDGFGFDSYMLKEEELGPNDPRLLAVDNKIVVPVDTTVRLQITAGDVIHAFAMPAFGVKVDAVPGRLNETWFNATKLGTFYGQCSELCGVGHAFMPIAVEVVTKEEFALWVENAKEKFAHNGNRLPTTLATLSK